MTPPPGDFDGLTPPPPDPAPTDPAMADPMLRVLRETHPEVDIVLLPQAAPSTNAPEVSHEQVETLVTTVNSALDALLERLHLDAPAAVGRDARWHGDPWGLQWYEAVAVIGPLERGGNVSLLRATGHALLGLGWQTRPVPGDRPRLVARRRGGLEAAATVRPTSLVVTLRTAKVRRAAEAAAS